MYFHDSLPTLARLQKAQTGVDAALRQIDRRFRTRIWLQATGFTMRWRIVGLGLDAQDMFAQPIGHAQAIIGRPQSQRFRRIDGTLKFTGYPCGSGVRSLVDDPPAPAEYEAVDGVLVGWIADGQVIG